MSEPPTHRRARAAAPGPRHEPRARPPRAPGTSRSPPRSTSRPGSARSTSPRSCAASCVWRSAVLLVARLDARARCRCSSRPCPASPGVDVLGVPLPWMLLTVVAFAEIIGLGWFYVRQSERNEDDLQRPARRPVSRVRRPVNNAASIVAVVLVSIASLAVGAFGLRLSRTMSDFYVASRGVSPVLNASAISGEYLSAASFLGVAGLILARGVDMLWLPVGWTAGYLAAARLRRGAAAPVGGLHAARLRPAAPRVRRGAARVEPARRRDRPALPHPAVPGRRA